MQHFLFAVILVVACATVSAADSHQDADSAYNRGDFALAARLLRSLAEQGNAVAQNNLGLMYDQGTGVPKDYQEAVKWYRLAAEQGDEEAQNSLGLMYKNGMGVSQDYHEAARWYRLAAEQGYAIAQNNLAQMYEKGTGVPKDFVRAHMWVNLAAAALSGDQGKIALENRDKLAFRMTATQIEEAQEMARRCQQSKFKECD